MIFDERSPLIAPALAEQLTGLFARLTEDVELICIAGEDGKSAEMGAFLNHLTALSPRLTVRFLAPGEDAVMDALLDASLLPATGVGGPLPRMIFHGVPAARRSPPSPVPS